MHLCIHKFIYAVIFAYFFSPFFDGGNAISGLQNFKILNGDKFFLVEIIFVQEHFLCVIRVVHYYLLEHVADLRVLILDSPFILNKDPQISP